jgi:hypothetical protein
MNNEKAATPRSMSKRQSTYPNMNNETKSVSQPAVLWHCCACGRDSSNPDNCGFCGANLGPLKEQASHTPTPWHVMADPAWAGKHPLHDARFITTSTDVDVHDDETFDGGKPWRFSNYEDSIICTMPDASNQKANAGFIVRACNAHDDLLAVCKRAFQNLEFSEAYALVDDLRAVIARAEGKL